MRGEWYERNALPGNGQCEDLHFLSLPDLFWVDILERSSGRKEMIFFQKDVDRIVNAKDLHIMTLETYIKRLEQDFSSERKRADQAIDQLLMLKQLHPVSQPVEVDRTELSETQERMRKHHIAMAHVGGEIEGKDAE